jgi:hypothetical protein
VVSVTPRPRFAPVKGRPVPIAQEDGWAPEPIWTQRLEEKSFAPAGDRKIWRLAGNIMNKESRTGGKGCSSSFEDGWRPNKPHHKQFATKQSVEPRNWADSYA